MLCVEAGLLTYGLRLGSFPFFTQWSTKPGMALYHLQQRALSVILTRFPFHPAGLPKPQRRKDTIFYTAPRAVLVYGNGAGCIFI
jgi:hypothetical protein